MGMMLRRYYGAVAKTAPNLSDNTEDLKENTEEPIPYKKSDITRMNLEKLKVLAENLGLEVTEESTGTKLKDEIIEHLGL